MVRVDGKHDQVTRALSESMASRSRGRCPSQLQARSGHEVLGMCALRRVGGKWFGPVVKGGGRGGGGGRWFKPGLGKGSAAVRLRGGGRWFGPDFGATCPRTGPLGLHGGGRWFGPDFGVENQADDKAIRDGLQVCLSACMDCG